MHNSLAMCGWWLWNRIRIISAFTILLLHPNRQIIFQSSALSAICCFFRQDLCKFLMHSHSKPKIKDVFLSCSKPIEIQIWKWYALWLSCMKWSSLAMIVFVLYLQVLTDALIRKTKWWFWNNSVCYRVFTVGEVPVPSLLNGESFLVSWLLGSAGKFGGFDHHQPQQPSLLDTQPLKRRTPILDAFFP